MASFGTPSKLGTPITPIKSSPLKQSQTPAKSAPTQPPPGLASAPPSTVIPSSWLAPYEQRRLVFTLFGLIEAIKIWEIIIPYFLDLGPTWSSSLRVRGGWTALGWTVFEIAAFALVSFLRIPLLSPSTKQLLQLAGLAALWNVVCWFVAEPGSFFMSIHLIGPVALGGEWYWAWWYAVKRLWEPRHLEGRHMIRLRPYSTATLNPLSLTYCIPPDSSQPLYVPIVFNNSNPAEVSYYLKSLEDGVSSLKTVPGSSLKRSSKARQLQLTDSEDADDEPEEADIDPYSALILHSNSKHDLAKIPSVKPADSLALIPPNLTPTQSVLYLAIDKPSIVHLKSVLDSQGDKFHITAHKEAVIIECPTEAETPKKAASDKKPVVAETRCVGAEEVVHFKVRGAGTLKASWKKRSSTGHTETGVIEGIQDEVKPGDEMALVPRDKITSTRDVPLRIKHDRPGEYTVSLSSITDSLHNTYTPSGHSAEKAFKVIPRPIAKFGGGPTREVLVDGTASIPLQIEGLSDDPVEIVYLFKPISGEAETRTLQVSKSSEVIKVSQPGMYTLQDIKGFCGGVIMEPSTVTVQLVPKPTVELQITTLHECAMDVGVTVGFEFTGKPPFMVEYTESRNNGRAAQRSTRFNGFTGEIVLQPDKEGEYAYSFVSLSDAKYSQVKLDKPPIKQTVHPLANVELLGPRKREMHSCSGEKVELEFEAKGANPLSLTFLESWLDKTKNTTWHIPSQKQKLFLTVPSELSEASGAVGRYSISFLAIEDGNKCVRKLSVPTIDIDINRQKPTARFAKSEAVTITEGESTKVPLRLSGKAPWTITYEVEGQRGKRVNTHDPNHQLTLDQRGIHRLTEIRDANCPGTIAEDGNSFEITYKARPQVEFIPSKNLQQDDSVVKAGAMKDWIEKHKPGSHEFKGTWRYKDTCAGDEDEVAVRFSGESPFELGYRYTSNGKTSRHTLKSAQETGILYLSSEAGQHRYDILEAKDSNYPSTPLSLILEHTVNSRPSASFIKHSTKPVCLDTPLKGDVKIKLVGKAPFNLDLAIRKPGSSKPISQSLTLDTDEWTLDLPYEVKDVGRHEISIVSISDSSECDAQIVNEEGQSTGIDVVESARIVPVDQVEDLCVGDTLDFLLQGKAPWMIEYEWLNKKHKVTSSSSSFSRYAEKKGTFTVKSVALKDNQCKREITNLSRRVHPLPSVKIQDGLDHLREGDEPAAFSVAFEGTPPFSFTYTRSEMHGNKMRVVETQTIGEIWEKQYTISSSAPGDYEVVSVTDKYCRYPRVTKRGDP